VTGLQVPSLLHSMSPVLARRRNLWMSARKSAFRAESGLIVVSLSFVARDPERKSRSGQLFRFDIAVGSDVGFHAHLVC
jgi:hypothetical protein